MKQIIITSILLLAAGTVIGITPSGDYLSLAVQAYERGYYQETVEAALQALADTASYGSNDILYLRTYLAFSLVALDREGEAVEVFKQMLRAKPKMELNPEFVSPKIISVFKRAQMEETQLSSQSAVQSGMLFERGRPARYDCLWRSALWPGWGQAYRGELRKGKVLKWSSLGIAAGVGALLVGTSLSRQSYLDATDPALIESRYEAYNRWYRTRNFGVNLMISFWAYSALDIMLTD
jgi:hypothetical protein